MSLHRPRVDRLIVADQCVHTGPLAGDNLHDGALEFIELARGNIGLNVNGLRRPQPGWKLCDGHGAPPQIMGS
jgi:hypothetical protein